MSPVSPVGEGPGSVGAGIVGHEPLLVVTTHELAALEQAHARGLVPPGGLVDEVDAEGTEGGVDGRAVGGVGGVGAEGEAPEGGGHLDQARRSLTGRGLLSLDGGLIAGSELGLLVQTVLDVRLGASALVVVERLLGEGQQDLRLLHLMAEGGVVEDVHPQGLHGFDLAVEPDDLVAAVTTMVVPTDAQVGTGPEVVVAPDDAALLPDLLHRPTVLAELTLVQPETEQTEAHLVALGPGGCFAAPRGEGGVELRFSPVDPGWVAQQVSSWVRETVQPMDEGRVGRGPDG